jgi:hypothetical protein
VRPRRGDEDEGDVEKEVEERSDVRGLSGCGSPIEDEAEVEELDDDDDDNVDDDAADVADEDIRAGKEDIVCFACTLLMG